MGYEAHLVRYSDYKAAFPYAVHILNPICGELRCHGGQRTEYGVGCGVALGEKDGDGYE